MSHPILYSFRRCPYAIRARMAIFYSGQKCELREVVLKNKPQAMLDISPKATVPVLHLKDQVIDESIDIMRWSLRQSNPDNWPLSELNDDLISRNDGPFKHALDRYKYYDRYPEQPQSYYFEEAYQHLEQLEMSFVANADGQQFLRSPRLSPIDVAIFPFVRQFAFVDKKRFDQLDLKKLKQWLQYHLDSDLFSSVMSKYRPWDTAQSEPVLFVNE